MWRSVVGATLFTVGVAVTTVIVATKFGDDNSAVIEFGSRVYVFERVSDEHDVGYLEDGSSMPIPEDHFTKYDTYGRTPKLRIVKHCTFRKYGWWSSFDLGRYNSKSYTDTTLYLATEK